MKHSRTLEADSRSTQEEIPRLLLNPEVRYRIHKVWIWTLSSAIWIQSYFF